MTVELALKRVKLVIDNNLRALLTEHGKEPGVRLLCEVSDYVAQLIKDPGHTPEPEPEPQPKPEPEPCDDTPQQQQPKQAAPEPTLGFPNVSDGT